MAKRILLADDSITIQKVVELTFSDGDYEVTAVNNGSKAIQKLSEMRPDIILSDIIMPEKNGYEVCEFVKSHPEYRNIPVILLTGTFEPFDPDRADKAGCDAVVTKPFESQSLIHKVEELIQNAPAQSQTAAPPAAPEAPAAAESPFATSAFQAQGSDIFGAPSATTSPFDEAPAATGETKAFPRMSFDELQKMANEPAAAAPPPPPPTPTPAEASPWDEPAPTSGETKAFPRMSFDELQQMANTAPPPPPPSVPEPSPWDETGPAATGGETKAFPRMSLDELQQMSGASSPSSSSTTPAPSPWDSGPTESASAHDTMTPFESPAAPPPAPESSSPWEEPAATSGETKAFPRMSFDELQQMASAPSPASTPEAPAAEEMPFSAPAPTPAASAEPSAATSSMPQDLTDEQIDRIARRVVQLMSQDIVKNIAWEVVPDMAEMVVKERIRQLESEA